MIRDNLPILTAITGLGLFGLLAGYADGLRGYSEWSVKILAGTVFLFAALMLSIVWAVPQKKKAFKSLSQRIV